MLSSSTLASAWAHWRPHPPLGLVKPEDEDQQERLMLARLQHAWHQRLRRVPNAVLPEAVRPLCYRGAPRKLIATVGDAATVPEALESAPWDLIAVFRHIRQALRTLESAVRWGVGEQALRRWARQHEIQRALGPAPVPVATAEQFLRAMLVIEEARDILDACDALIKTDPQRRDTLALIGYTLLAYGPPSPETADAARRYFVRALDALPPRIAASASFALHYYAALADGLAGQPLSALARLEAVMETGDERPIHRIAWMKWRLLAGNLDDDVYEALEALVVDEPLLLLDLLTDEVLRQHGIAGDLLERLRDRSAAALATTVEGLKTVQRAVSAKRKHAMQMPARRHALLVPREGFPRLIETVMARCLFARMEQEQETALALAQTLDTALTDLDAELNGLPRGLTFRVATSRRIFAPVLKDDDDSDLRRIATLAETGDIAGALQYTRDLHEALNEGTARAMAELADCIATGMDGLILYGADVQRDNPTWTEDLLPSLREGRHAMRTVHEVLRGMGLAKHTEHVAPKLKAAWRLIQKADKEWRAALKKLPPLELYLTDGQGGFLPLRQGKMAIPLGDWRVARIMVTDDKHFGVRGVPVSWSTTSQRVRRRWPFARLVPGYRVTLATGETFLPLYGDLPTPEGEADFLAVQVPTSETPERVELRVVRLPGR